MKVMIWFMGMKNKTKGLLIAGEVEYADYFLSRMKGLIGRDSMKPSQAFVLERCNGVHTCFMRFDIDILYLDRMNRVIRIIQSMKPFRFGPVIRGCRRVAELAGGSLKEGMVELGDIISFDESI